MKDIITRHFDRHRAVTTSTYLRSVPGIQGFCPSRWHAASRQRTRLVFAVRNWSRMASPTDG